MHTSPVTHASHVNMPIHKEVSHKVEMVKVVKVIEKTKVAKRLRGAPRSPSYG